MRPHKSQYWLNPKIDDVEAFRERVTDICRLYQGAQESTARGTRVISCDEKTGIQALERIAETKPSRPKQIEKREYEYRRHGTLCLIGSFDVATGKIISESMGPTRTETDFVEHLAKTVATDPEAEWVFVCDQLNTHKSESLVRWVVEACGLEVSAKEMGVKGKSGHLESMETRAKFLEDRSHRIRLLYTPRHCSWLNQIEVWFGILSAKVIRRGNFSSLADLEEKIRSFIDYFAQTMSKPFKWKYKGIAVEA